MQVYLTGAAIHVSGKHKPWTCISNIALQDHNVTAGTAVRKPMSIGKISTELLYGFLVRPYLATTLEQLYKESYVSAENTL